VDNRTRLDRIYGIEMTDDRKGVEGIGIEMYAAEGGDVLLTGRLVFITLLVL